MKSTIVVHVKSSFSEFMLVGKEWDCLLQKCERNEVCLTHEWFQSWWGNFGDEKNMLLLLFRKGDELVGIVPLLQQDVIYHKIVPVRRISFWENGISPSVDIIVPKKHKREVITAFIEYMYANQHLWDICALGKILSDSDTHNLFLEVLGMKRIAFVEKQSIRTPYIGVHGSWNNYFSTRSKKFRKAMRNNLNRIKKYGDISIERNHSSEDLVSVLPEIFDVSQKSWKHLQNSSILDSEQRPFYESFTKTAGGKGWIDIWILRHKGIAVAFQYHVIYKKKSYALRGDFDEKFGFISPGAYLEYNIIKNYFEEGSIEIYDFCGNAYQYKFNWTNDMFLHKYINMFNNNVKSLLVKFLEIKMIPLYKNLFRKKTV